MKQGLKRARPSEQHVARSRQSSERLRQLDGWMLISEVAEKLRFTVSAPSNPEDACRAFLRRKGVVGLRRGRLRLISVVEVERLLRGMHSVSLGHNDSTR